MEWLHAAERDITASVFNTKLLNRIHSARNFDCIKTKCSKPGLRRTYKFVEQFVNNHYHHHRCINPLAPE